MKEKKTTQTHPLCEKKMSPIRESVKAATAVTIFTFWILSKFVNLRENIEPSRFAIKEKLVKSSKRRVSVCVCVSMNKLCMCLCVGVVAMLRMRSCV